MIKLLQKILDGIDQTEIEYKNGWWETSTGADFGAKKLHELEKLWKETFECQETNIINKKLEEIEARFFSWSYLSDQQNDDITWLINTLRNELKERNKWKLAI